MNYKKDLNYNNQEGKNIVDRMATLGQKDYI